MATAAPRSAPAPGDATGTRLDRALIAVHPELSRRKAREVIERGQVLVDDAPVLEAGAPVAPGAVVRWDATRQPRPRVRPPLPLLYEDRDLVIVDKPAGLLSVPTGRGERDHATALGLISGYAERLPGRRRASAVHRLDRGTSGALCFALSQAARHGLRALFRAHRIERRYSALVSGRPPGEEGAVDLPLRDAYRGGRRGVARPDEPGKPALTRWRVVERFDGAALLDVTLETGRQHQIRVHLAAIGLPIVGDALYRRERAPHVGVPAQRPLLHSARLAFAHPLTGEAVRATSPLPADFLAVLRRLRARRRPPAR